MVSKTWKKKKKKFKDQSNLLKKMHVSKLPNDPHSPEVWKDLLNGKEITMHDRI